MQAVVGFDARSSKIFVQATKEEHAEIQRLLKLSQDPSNSVAVIQLTKPTNWHHAVNSVENLFLAEGTRAPSVEADIAGRRIMVRGTGDQLSQIRALLGGIWEKFRPAAVWMSSETGSPTRIVVTSGS